MDVEYILYQIRADMWNILLAQWKTAIATPKYWGVVATIIMAYRNQRDGSFESFPSSCLMYVIRNEKFFFEKHYPIFLSYLPFT